MLNKVCTHKDHVGDPSVSVADFRKNKSSKDGLSHYCKQCCKRIQQQYYQQNSERVKHKTKQYAMNNQAIVKQTRKHSSKKWRENNPTYAQEYYKSNKEHLLEWMQIWYSKNRDRVLANREHNKDRLNEYSRQWRKNNPDKVNALTNKRRAALLNAIPNWADLDKIKTIYSECADLSLTSGVEHHVDHKIPLMSDTVCGLHCEDNLQILTAVDNLSKGNQYSSGG